jgi:hypothetical protein
MKRTETKRQKEQRLRAQAKGWKLPRAVDQTGLQEYQRCLHAFVYTATRRGVA